MSFTPDNESTETAKKGSDTPKMSTSNWWCSVFKNLLTGKGFSGKIFILLLLLFLLTFAGSLLTSKHDSVAIAQGFGHFSHVTLMPRQR